MLPEQRNIDRRKKAALILVALGILLTASVSVLFIIKPAFFIFLDHKIFDTQLRSVHSHETTSVPVIVDIDERSLMEFGQWPWPRYLVANLLDNVQKMGAASIALDIIFAEQDRTSLAVLKEEIRRDLDVDIPCLDAPDLLFDNDKILAEVLSSGPFLLGYKFSFSDKPLESNKDPAHSVNIMLLSDSGLVPNSPALIRAAGVIENLAELSTAAQGAGFLNFVPDEDSITRRIPLLIAYKGKIYPSLPLAAILEALNPKRLTLASQSAKEQFLYIDDKKIPLDGNGRLLIHYRGRKKAFSYISAADVLNGMVPRSALQNKIAFVGSSAAGLEEMRTTPLERAFPGVEVHATVADNILKGDFLARPAWAPGLELLFVVAFGLGSTVLLVWLRAWWGAVFILACGIGVWKGAEMTFRDSGFFISPLFPLIVLGVNFSALNLLKYWREEQEVRCRDKEILLAQEFTIQCLASLAETRDTETGGHILRTQRYVKALCNELSAHPKFRKYLTAPIIEMLYKATPLHDIGKVGIPDSILLKDGKLTDDELEQMKHHTTYGRDVIANALKRLGGQEYGSLFFRCAKELIHTHHEKWDGSGYPQGLRGEDIPVSGRIMALADVYDALISRRVYKEAYSHEDAIQIIVEGKGKHFDPDVVDAFLQIEGTFKQISSEFGDDCSRE